MTTPEVEPKEQNGIERKSNAIGQSSMEERKLH